MRWMLQRLVCLLLAASHAAADEQSALPVIANASSTFVSAGGRLTVNAWHAHAPATIAWSVAAAEASALDRVAVYEDAAATRAWLAAWNPWLAADATLEAVAADFNFTSAGAADWCADGGGGAPKPYAYDRWGPFWNATAFAAADVRHDAAWFYTAGAGRGRDGGQDADAAAAAAAAAAAPSTAGALSVVLSEVGLFQVCIFLAAASACAPRECVTVEVYQPPYDFMTVEHNNIVEPVALRYSVVTIDAYPGDWINVVANLSADATPENTIGAPALDNSPNLCWVYPSAAMEARPEARSARTYEPLLCLVGSKDMSEFTASPGAMGYQWGAMAINMGGAGRLSAMYAMNELYNFAMITHFYLCGVTVVQRHPPPGAPAVLPSTASFLVDVDRETGGACAPTGRGFPIAVSTTQALLGYLGVPARVSFEGATDAMGAAGTQVSILVPVAGDHTVALSLTGGVSLGELPLTVRASAAHAASTEVLAAPPSSVATGAAATLLLRARDRYANALPAGGTAFHAAISGADAGGSAANITDYGNGTFTVTATFIGKGTQYLSVYLIEDAAAAAAATTASTSTLLEAPPPMKPSTGGAATTAAAAATTAAADHAYSHIPGSPFEVYVVGLRECNAGDVASAVGACGRDARRPVTYSWRGGGGGGAAADAGPCSGGMPLPSPRRVECDEIPLASRAGAGLTALAAFTALYAGAFAAFIVRRRDHWVVRYSQPLFCGMFLGGCTALAGATVLHLGPATPAVCMARPWLQHVLLTFTLSCILVKLHRAWRLFSFKNGLKRIKISNRDLVKSIALLCGVDVLILTLWYAVAPPYVAHTTALDQFAVVPHASCRTHAPAFATALWAYKALLMVVGLYLSAKTWNLQDTVAESKPIASSFYNISVLVLINSMVYALVGSPTVGALVHSVTINTGCLIATTLFFAPKAYKVLRDAGEDDASEGNQVKIGPRKRTRKAAGPETRGSAGSNSETAYKVNALAATTGGGAARYQDRRSVTGSGGGGGGGALTAQNSPLPGSPAARPARAERMSVPQSAERSSAFSSGYSGSCASGQTTARSPVATFRSVRQGEARISCSSDTDDVQRSTAAPVGCSSGSGGGIRGGGASAASAANIDAARQVLPPDASGGVIAVDFISTASEDADASVEQRQQQRQQQQPQTRHKGSLKVLPLDDDEDVTVADVEAPPLLAAQRQQQQQWLPAAAGAAPPPQQYLTSPLRRIESHHEASQQPPPELQPQHASSLRLY